MQEYDKYIVAFSGGKDSTACFLHLLDIGIPKDKIELWHHDIDGRGETFMDWEITPAYCQSFADAFGVPIYFSWKDGGFKGEMLRENSKTASTSFVTPDGDIVTIGGTRGKENTRLKFPQVSADLSVRWCSAYLKINVCGVAVRNQKRFIGLKTVIISGERGEESKARSNYNDLEPDFLSDNRNGTKANRYVDKIRPIKNWLEKEVWSIIERYGVRVHPCYYMGYSRCSCKFCIFGNADQFASSYRISRVIGEEIIGYEDQFETTIKRNMTLRELILLGKPYQGITKELAELACSNVYDQSIFMNENEQWLLPAGAYGDGCGPM